MLLSLKHVKTLPFASVYLHTDFQNNGQQLAHFNEPGVYSLCLRGVFATTEPERLVLIAANLTQNKFP